MAKRLVEVAEYAGVSEATVSRVLNGKPGVAESTNKSHPKEQVRFIELPDNADDQRQRMIQNAQLESGEWHAHVGERAGQRRALVQP